jgi:hypothetical protein
MHSITQSAWSACQMHTTGHMDTGFDTDMRATVRASKVRAAEQQQRYWCYKECMCVPEARHCYHQSSMEGIL